jgi:aryl-alcohol dehydrogenase-like predicted oxidoreductase
MLTDERRNRQVMELMGVAERLDVSVAQLALGWCAANPNVSTVITGASRPEQVVENMGALRALEQITPEIKHEIEGICLR